MYSFLPSYTGSKKMYLDALSIFKGRPFVEPFAGSAILSSNLASHAVLNDLDPYVYKILSRYDEQIVPELFTKDEYMRVRSRDDWWKYAYCLQKMSFSGVFRYSKSGFNVPPKPITGVRLVPDYQHNLRRWKELSPIVLNQDYATIPSYHLKDAVIVLDPPYEGAKTAYNKGWDSERYRPFIERCQWLGEAVIVFDFRENLEKWGFTIADSRTICLNGKNDTSTESVAIFYNGVWQSSIEAMFGQTEMSF